MTRVIDKGKSYAFLPQFERGPRGDTTGRVEKILRSAIVRLDFAPGEFIDKGLVCLQLGVSRFPVSEALARLANEGLVEVCRNGAPAPPGSGCRRWRKRC